MTARGHEPSSPFLLALEAAAVLGRADGRTAAAFEPSGEPAAVGPCCHGLDPEDLARLVWDAGAGTPPAGLRLNAPLWYAQGFREALADARSQRHHPGAAGPPPAESGRPPTAATSRSTPARRALPSAPGPAGTGTPSRRGLPEPF